MPISYSALQKISPIQSIQISIHQFHLILISQFFHDNLWKTIHIIFLEAFCFQIPIFLMFWLYIYPQVDLPPGRIYISNVNLHGGFCLCIVIDFLLNDILFHKRYKQHQMNYLNRFLHIVLLSAFVYGVVNATYVVVQKKAIYPGVSWDNLVTLVVVPVAFLALLGSFFLGHIYDRKVKMPTINSRNQRYPVQVNKTESNDELLK